MSPAPWEREMLLRVAHEVGCWNRGEVRPLVAMHNIAGYLRVAVKPLPVEPPRRSRKRR